MYTQTNVFPNVFVENAEHNPLLTSPNSEYAVEFALTKEGSYDLDEYKAFLDSAIREFRHSRTYKHYKAYLYSIGLDCCQFHPNITAGNDEGEEMASLEMHHCMLNIYDIAIIITEHILNTYGAITEFDLSDLLRYEHTQNNIPVVMLCKTCHQMYHHKYLYVHPEMIFGKWWSLLERYPNGLNRDIAYKLMMYLNNSLDGKYKFKEEQASKLLELRDKLYDWSTRLER